LSGIETRQPRLLQLRHILLNSRIRTAHGECGQLRRINQSRDALGRRLRRCRLREGGEQAGNEEETKK